MVPTNATTDNTPTRRIEKRQATGPPGLPAWIEAKPSFWMMTVRQRHTLRQIADRCDWTPLADGSLGVALFGESFCEAIGLCRRTLLMHLRTFEENGFAVCVGVVGKAGACAWAIPGSFGCLDHLRTTQRSGERRFKSIYALKADLQKHTSNGAQICTPTTSECNDGAQKSTDGAQICRDGAQIFHDGAQICAQPLKTPSDALQNPPPASRDEGGVLRSALKEIFGLKDGRRLDRAVADLTDKATADGVDPAKAVRAKADAFRVADPRTTCTPELVLYRWDTLSTGSTSEYHEALRAQTLRRQREDDEDQRQRDEEAARIAACTHPEDARRPIRGGAGTYCGACGLNFFNDSATVALPRLAATG